MKLNILNSECSLMTKESLIEASSNLNVLEDFLKLYFYLYIVATVILGALLLIFIFTYRKSI